MHGALVLVVDDDADIRRLVVRLLRIDGHTAEEAESGLAALDRVRRGAIPEVVILDVQMPDLDGWDTLRALRGIPGTADMRVILCTVKAFPADMIRGWKLGCDGYVTKPFGIEALRAEVGSVLARAREERAAHRARMIKALGDDAAGPVVS